MNTKIKNRFIVLDSDSAMNHMESNLYSKFIFVEKFVHQCTKNVWGLYKSQLFPNEEFAFKNIDFLYDQLRNKINKNIAYFVKENAWISPADYPLGKKNITHRDRQNKPRQVLYANCNRGKDYTKFVKAENMPLWATRYKLSHEYTEIIQPINLTPMQIIQTGVRNQVKHSFINKLLWNSEEKELKARFKSKFDVNDEDWIVIHTFHILNVFRRF